jgi:hypothetical protein
MKVGRNDPCPCGSGLKYKNCHLRAAGEAQPADQLWQRLHELSMRLPTDLLRFARSRYGRDLIDEAWREFSLFEEESFDQESVHLPVFMPWFFYDWEPDPEETFLSPEQLGAFPLASAYLKSRGRNEDPLATRYLQACLGSAFSFLEVLTVSPGAGFTMRDSLTGLESTVVERTASKTVQVGDILFAKLVSLDGLAILDGCSPLAFPPLEKATIIQLRKLIRKAYPEVTAEVLRDYGLEMLEIYHATADRLLNPKLPVLENTDGEPLMLCRVTYEITSARVAFEALRPLSLDESESDLLEDARFDDHGQLVAVEIPWLKKADVQMAWQTIGLGRILIEGDRLVAEVNSEERAKRFRELADQLLPDGCRHLATVLESMEAALEAHRRDPPAEAQEDLEESPEVKALLADHLRAHYRAWPKMKLPALDGKTPLEAMRTDEGREMVEALLLDLEQRSRTGRGVAPEIIAELRGRLKARGPN